MKGEQISGMIYEVIYALPPASNLCRHLATFIWLPLSLTVYEAEPDLDRPLMLPPCILTGVQKGHIPFNI